VNVKAPFFLTAAIASAMVEAAVLTSIRQSSLAGPSKLTTELAKLEHSSLAEATGLFTAVPDVAA
jgi:hypothetical protein